MIILLIGIILVKSSAIGKCAMSVIGRIFTEHPASVNETYLQHLLGATQFGLTMIFAGIACLIHGLVPIAFVSRGSDTICSLYQRMVTNRQRVRDQDCARVA
jgi:hypothetical protein